MYTPDPRTVAPTWTTQTCTRSVSLGRVVPRDPFLWRINWWKSLNRCQLQWVAARPRARTADASVPLPALGPVRGGSGWTQRVTQRLGGNGAGSPMALLPYCCLCAPYVLRGTPKCSSEHIGSKTVAPRERVGVTYGLRPGRRYASAFMKRSTKVSLWFAGLLPPPRLPIPTVPPALRTPQPSILQGGCRV
jgi:hypothetical protein